MSRPALATALFAAFLLLGTGAVHAQEVDTTATDSTITDTTAIDTTATDAMAADTTVSDTPSADTIRTAVDTMHRAAPDSLQRPDTTVAAIDSAARARRKRAKQQARTAAESWLSLIETGEFSESWDAADSTLQAGISREDWIDQGIRAWSRLDTLRFRQLVKAQYRDSTAQLPGGSPVVTLQYASEFEGGSTLEAVITTKRDTAWKVVGYRAIPAPTDSTLVQPDSTEQEGVQ